MAATASFGDVFQRLNSIPIIGATELRYGRIGLLSDVMAMSLKSDLRTRGVLFSGADFKLTQLIATVLPTYRVLDLPRQSLDLGAGVRVVALWSTFEAQSGRVPGFSRKTSITWADPIVAARYHYDLSRRWGLTAYGDIGSDGTNPTWQIYGSIDYRYSSSLTMHAGYQHLVVNHHGDSLQSDTGMSGPMMPRQCDSRSWIPLGRCG